MKFSVFIFKSTFWTIFLSLILMLESLPSFALTVQDVPNPRQNSGGWVTDMAEIISASREDQLNGMISKLKASNGSEIAVVTLSETKPAKTPKEFATELFNYWGIGKKDQDNGVLFLISQGDHRVEIETGKGIQDILPDAKVSNLLDTKIIPQFKLGLFEAGIIAGTTALVASLNTAEYSLVDSSINYSNILIIGILLILVLLIIFFYINSRNRSRSYSYKIYSSGSSRSSYSGGTPSTRRQTQISSRSSGNTNDISDDGSSADVSFGGGSSDGGGAGGSWSETSTSSSEGNNSSSGSSTSSDSEDTASSRNQTQISSRSSGNTNNISHGGSSAHASFGGGSSDGSWSETSTSSSGGYSSSSSSGGYSSSDSGSSDSGGSDGGE